MPVNLNPTPNQNPIHPPQPPEEKAQNIVDKINDFLLRFSSVPLKEKLFFVQHLGLMLRSGISLSVALKTLGEQTENPKLKKILKEIASKVDKGNSFAECLEPYKNIFGEMFVNMVAAGEASGKLENVLQQIYLQMKKEHALISRIKGALTYPAIIVIAMIGIGIFMMMFIVPKITSIFLELNAELPLATKILIAVSNAMANHALTTIIIIIFTVVLIIQILRTHQGKYWFQALLLHLPIFGPIVKKVNVARFSRNISSLLQTDIMIIRAFQITAKVLGNLHYRKALMEMSQEIKKGGTVHETIKKYPKLFPPVVVQMVAVGEETGSLDSILIELADFYEEEINQIMENLPSIIEPLLILMLGLGVGGVAVAIILPMYNITTAI
ncbi:type II secretion system F family protein [Candidatus Parcubacteria bacterium]|nr:MAG: type II secretion system F family protein [Candidatus Parcubacteria bacterium]